MNSLLNRLEPYPFERLRVLFTGLTSPSGGRPINFGIGEPQHETPDVVTEAIKKNLCLLGKYPPTGGTPELRGAISDWLQQRYGASVDPDREILPVAGTREALFAFAQAVLNPSDTGVVLIPNPFYQIYEGAAFLAGAEPYYVPTPKKNGYLPDWESVPDAVWPRVKLVYACSPGNPTGANLSAEDWKALIDLSDRYGFVIAADECYSEIYSETPPIGILEVATNLGRSYERIVSFNSLSKRSSCPGLRSGFVAGDAEILERFLLYRTYHGAAPSLVTQAASVAAWRDEDHVDVSRILYREKFQAASSILPNVQIPDGGFFLWLPCLNDEKVAQTLFTQFGVTVLPGTYLGRDSNGINPGLNHVRVALVPDLKQCEMALRAVRSVVYELND